jgi:pyruvate/2-oxoglutarate dehydrogenase complex dihydrolipoamide acyltransferase (E2) component
MSPTLDIPMQQNHLLSTLIAAPAAAPAPAPAEQLLSNGLLNTLLSKQTSVAPARAPAAAAAAAAAAPPAPAPAPAPAAAPAPVQLSSNGLLNTLLSKQTSVASPIAAVKGKLLAESNGKKNTTHHVKTEATNVDIIEEDNTDTTTIRNTLTIISVLAVIGIVLSSA